MQIFTFRLSIFGDFKQFTPTTSNMLKLTQALQKERYDYLPSIVQVPNLVGNIPFAQVAVGLNDKRMQFVSPSGDVAVRILLDRIDVELLQGIADTPDQYFVDKIEIALSVIKIILNTLENIHGIRLAYYVDLLIPEVEGKSFNDFYNKNNLDISMDAPEDNCVEWTHRFNRRTTIRIGTVDEMCNVILLMEAGKLQTANAQSGEQQIIKGLHVLADINTLAENNQERFSIDSLCEFSPKAQTIFLEFLKQIMEKI